MARGVEYRLMGAHSVSEVECANDLARGQVDDEHLVAIEARLADADVAVDGYIGGAPIGGSGDLMPVHGWCVLSDDGNLFCGRRIDDAEAGVSLIDDQKRLRADRKGGCEAKTREEQTRKEGLLHERHYKHCRASEKAKFSL